MLSEEKMSVDEVKTNNVAVAVKKAKRKSGRKWTKEDDEYSPETEKDYSPNE